MPAGSSLAPFGSSANTTTFRTRTKSKPTADPDPGRQNGSGWGSPSSTDPTVSSSLSYLPPPPRDPPGLASITSTMWKCMLTRRRDPRGSWTPPPSRAKRSIGPWFPASKSVRWAPRHRPLAPDHRLQILDPGDSSLPFPSPSSLRSPSFFFRPSFSPSQQCPVFVLSVFEF